MVCNGPGGRFRLFLFVLFIFLLAPVLGPRLCFCSCCSSVVVGPVVAMRLLFVSLFLAELPRVLCLFKIFCGGCAWGVLFVCGHLLKRVCSSPTGASQHAIASPPLCPLSVLLMLACLSFGIWWYWVMLCTRMLSYRRTCGAFTVHARTGDLGSDPGLAAGCLLGSSATCA